MYSTQLWSGPTIVQSNRSLWMWGEEMRHKQTASRKLKERRVGICDFASIQGRAVTHGHVLFFFFLLNWMLSTLVLILESRLDPWILSKYFLLLFTYLPPQPGCESERLSWEGDISQCGASTSGRLLPFPPSQSSSRLLDWPCGQSRWQPPAGKIPDLQSPWAVPTALLLEKVIPESWCSLFKMQMPVKKRIKSFTQYKTSLRM